MKKYLSMGLGQLLGARCILVVKSEYLDYLLAETKSSFYLNQANYVNSELEYVDSLLDIAYGIHPDNLCRSTDLLSQFSCN